MPRRALAGFSTLAMATWISVLSACASAPGPGDPGYGFNLEGRYEGRVHLDDQPFDALLSLTTEPDGRVRGTFRVRDGVALDGQVEGVIVDDLLRIRITYVSPGGCDGSMDGVLTIEPGGIALDGPVAVRDCTGPASGRLAFRRRQPSTRTGAPPSRAER
jgi:hypothetical protein